jgi:lipoprotein NlpD
VVDTKPLPGAENLGKPGYYTVRAGDTLIRISLDSGQNWRDIARWNNIENPNLIEVGQVLRVIPPVNDVAGARTVTAAPSSAPAVGTPAAPAAGTTAPVTGAPAAAGTPAVAAASAPRGAASGPVATLPPPPADNVPPASAGLDDVPWAWPTSSATIVLAGFDEQRNKGLDLAGKQGDPVLASADGRVVYAGAGLRGYGNLIILKHNNTFLSAYAHNQALMVKEDQTVRKGQKIAEMGSSDADRVKLHFEIRRQGKPVDPAKYLPPR